MDLQQQGIGVSVPTTPQFEPNKEAYHFNRCVLRQSGYGGTHACMDSESSPHELRQAQLQQVPIADSVDVHFVRENVVRDFCTIRAMSEAWKIRSGPLLLYTSAGAKTMSKKV